MSQKLTLKMQKELKKKIWANINVRVKLYLTLNRESTQKLIELGAG